MDSIGVEGVNYPFNYEKPVQIFEDCIGNLHVIGVNNVYQIELYPDTMKVVGKITTLEFEHVLSPCTAYFDSSLVIRELMNHNQTFTLSLFNNDSIPKVFYTKTDEISAKVAQENALLLSLKNNHQNIMDSTVYYRLYTRRELRGIFNGENPDINYAFLRSKKWENAVADYMQSAYPINIRSFQVGEEIVVVDFEDDSVSVFSSIGDLVYQVQFDASMEIINVWQDNWDQSLYLYSKVGLNHKVYRLNVQTGEVEFRISFKKMPFTKTQKVYNGWLYYRTIENGYHSISRVKMKS